MGESTPWLASREALLATIGPDRMVLEIGPFNTPLLRGPNIHYLDVLDAEGLRRRAMQKGRDPSGCPAVIHHVGGLEQVDQSYDAVLSSHAIEHQPDLIGHLREIERVLVPGGTYLLIVPDKLYCFDHFLPESTIADVLQAWREQRSTHTLKSVIEHRALTTHNDHVRHWAGDHGKAVRGRTARVRAAIEEYDRAAGAYIDVHAWAFTPESFQGLMETSRELGLIALETEGVGATPECRNEFCAILRKPG
jgi:SAM-dependent methyltransferase